MGGKIPKKSRESLCVNHRDSFLKNKFAVLNNSVEVSNLSGWFKSNHFLYLSIKKKSTGLDKWLKHKFYFLFS